MSKLSIFIPILVVIGFVLSDCKKHKHLPFIEMDNDSGVITHFNFQPGTYWIYRDGLNGRIDSFYVRDNRFVPTDENTVTYNYHYITIAELNLDGSNPADSANWIFNYEGTKLMANYDYSPVVYGWRHQVLYQPLYVYPFFPGEDMKSVTDTASITKVDTAYTINGLTFNHAAHIYHFSNKDSTAGPFITPYTDSLVVNDSVGMIRISINHPLHHVQHDWQLIRFNIIR